MLILATFPSGPITQKSGGLEQKFILVAYISSNIILEFETYQLAHQNCRFFILVTKPRNFGQMFSFLPKFFGIFEVIGPESKMAEISISTPNTEVLEFLHNNAMVDGGNNPSKNHSNRFTEYMFYAKFKIVKNMTKNFLALACIEQI